MIPPRHRLGQRRRCGADRDGLAMPFSCGKIGAASAAPWLIVRGRELFHKDPDMEQSMPGWSLSAAENLGSV